MIIQEKINYNITIGIFKDETLYFAKPSIKIKGEGVQKPIYYEVLWEI